MENIKPNYIFGEGGELDRHYCHLHQAMPMGIVSSRTAAYLIEQSALFDGAAYLSRTPGSAGNRKTWTFSCWIKPSQFASNTCLLSAFTDNNNRSSLRFQPNQLEVLTVSGASTVQQVIPNAVFADVSAWYHICVATDTTQATAADRTKVFINGAQITSFATQTNPTQNADTYLNHTNITSIGRLEYSTPQNYFSGLMALPILVDGAALDYTSFAEIDAEGYINPIEYTGSYGTCGGLYDFSNSSHFGEDQAGSNDFTDSGFVAADQLADTPTDDADLGIGNFCTHDVLRPALGGTVPTFSEANMVASIITGCASIGNIGVSSGKWQFELTVTVDATSSYPYFGVVEEAVIKTGDLYDTGGSYNDLTSFGAGVKKAMRVTGKKIDGSSIVNGSTYGTATPLNGTMTCYLDLDNGAMWMASDNVLQDGDGTEGDLLASDIVAYNATAIAAAMYTGLSGTFFPLAGSFGAATFTLNCGQKAFVGDTITGFKALATQNLPAASYATPLTGSFTGNASANGPFVYLGAAPDTSGTSTINGNTITWGTHARATATGFKIITSSASYNTAGSNTYSIDVLTVAEGGAFQGGTGSTTQGRAR